MFNVFIPPALYEKLPYIYLVTAALLALLPLSHLRWLPVAALVLAAGITLRKRYAFRALRTRRS